MKKDPNISIVIPAYNEEENISWVVKDTLKYLPKYFKDFEIIIVDDGSKDRTGEISNQLSDKYKEVRVVHQKNEGYSNAMLTGIRNSKKKFVAYLPADGQYLVNDLAKLYPMMQDSDLVLGFRGIRKDYNLYRKFLSYGYLIFLHLLFGITVKDLNGPNIWRTQEINKLKKIYSINSKGVFILAEIVARFKQRGLKISEAESVYRSRRAGTVKNTKFRVVKDTWIDALKVKWKMITGEAK